MSKKADACGQVVLHHAYIKYTIALQRFSCCHCEVCPNSKNWAGNEGLLVLSDGYCYMVFKRTGLCPGGNQLSQRVGFKTLLCTTENYMITCFSMLTEIILISKTVKLFNICMMH